MNKVSIHAPAKEATALTQSSGGQYQSFNPRPREGGDILSGAYGFAYTAVSIHAPAKEATLRSDERFAPYAQFQSTPPRRRRLSTL